MNVSTHIALLWMYLIEYVGVSRVEEVRQPLLYSFDYLWPHRVHQEIIARHYVSFVAEERGTAAHLKNVITLPAGHWVLLQPVTLKIMSIIKEEKLGGQ